MTPKEFKLIETLDSQLVMVAWIFSTQTGWCLSYFCGTRLLDVHQDILFLKRFHNPDLKQMWNVHVRTRVK